MSDVTPTSAEDRELHRRQMLKLLGVQPLVSRFDPPGAAAAKRRLLAARSQPAASAVPAPVPRSPTSRSDDAPPARSVAVEFSLVMVTAGGILWVEALEDGLLQDAQLQLTAAMARALGRGGSGVSQRRFDWPLPGNLNVPADMASARQSVAALVARLLEESGADTLVVMGDAALPPLEAVTTVRKAIPATRAMLIEPALKREAWRQLVAPRG